MTPTQSQLNAWQPGVLADAGAGLNAMAQNLSADARKMFNSVHAMGGNGAWRGVAQASAETAVEAQTVAAWKVVTLLEGTSDILGAGAREMRGRREYLHSLLEAASADGMTVDDGWTVHSPGGTVSAVDSKELLNVRTYLQLKINDAVAAIDKADSDLAQRIRNRLAAEGRTFEDSVNQQKQWAAVEATTVASIVDGVNSAGQPIKTIAMVDGSKQVMTQTLGSDGYDLNNLRPMTETQSFDKSGAPLSKTELYAPDHAGMTRMYTHYETGMEIEVVTDFGGKQSTTITAPHRSRFG